VGFTLTLSPKWGCDTRVENGIKIINQKLELKPIINLWLKLKLILKLAPKKTNKKNKGKTFDEGTKEVKRK
jgi:hypothetical protein